MKKQMNEITVFTNEYDGTTYTCIEQPFPMDDDMTVVIHPDQLDILIAWLKDAKREIEQG